MWQTTIKHFCVDCIGFLSLNPQNSKALSPSAQCKLTQHSECTDMYAVYQKLISVALEACAGWVTVYKQAVIIQQPIKKSTEEFIVSSVWQTGAHCFHMLIKSKLQSACHTCIFNSAKALKNNFKDGTLLSAVRCLVEWDFFFLYRYCCCRPLG